MVPTKSLDFDSGHSLDPHFGQGFPDFVQLEWFYDCYDEFHIASLCMTVLLQRNMGVKHKLQQYLRFGCNKITLYGVFG